MRLGRVQSTATLATVLAFALTALASATDGIKDVLRGEGMPPSTMGLPGVLGPQAGTPTLVLSSCNGLQMIGVDTPERTTQVIEVQSLWNRTDQVFVRPSVRPDTPTSSIGSWVLVRDGERPIAPIRRAGPQPTRGEIRACRGDHPLDDVRPEPNFWGLPTGSCATGMGTEPLPRTFLCRGVGGPAPFADSAMVSLSHAEPPPVRLGVVRRLGVFLHSPAPLQYSTEAELERAFQENVE